MVEDDVQVCVTSKPIGQLDDDYESYVVNYLDNSVLGGNN